MHAANVPDAPVDAEALSGDQLASALFQAKSEWSARGADVSDVSGSVEDLGGLTLGAESGGHITLDTDAAGWGWDVTGGSGPRMDLLTVVRHEVGHAVGLEHTADGLMNDELAVGESRSVDSAPAPEAVAVDEPDASGDVSTAGGSDGSDGSDGGTTAEESPRTARRPPRAAPRSTTTRTSLRPPAASPPATDRLRPGPSPRRVSPGWCPAPRPASRCPPG